MISNSYANAILNFFKADAAWQKELEIVFKGKAGDARYTEQGISTPELARLHGIRMTAFHAWDKARQTA